MKTITKIVPQKKRKNRVSIFLDGEFLCGIPLALVSKLDLFPGKSIDENEISRLIDKKLTEEAKQKIVQLLNRRMYSEREIVDKLKSKAYGDRIIDVVIGDLKAISLIDDLAYAKAFVSDRLHLKPQGSFRIAYELRKRGISEKIIAQTFSEQQVPETDLQRAFEITERRIRSLSSIKDKRTKKRRLYNFLLRRGFSYEVIREVLARVFEKKTRQKPKTTLVYK
jgi:regulatory protein